MRRVFVFVLLWAWMTGAGCPNPGLFVQRDRENQDSQVYELYRRYMETLNQNRERAGAPPLPIRSFEEWRRSSGTP
jgi:hypothetical protein